MINPGKIVVTGLSGLIGGRLARLATDRFDLVNVDITEGIDITDSGQIEAVLKRHADCAAVIHLAAFTNVSQAHEQRGDLEGSCYRLNVGGTRNVAAACASEGIHLIHVSTDFVFDGARDEPYTEKDSPSPVEWYGETKWLAEQEVRETEAWTIVRTAFPYVAGPLPRLDHVRNFYEKLRDGKPLSLFTDQITTPTFADDIIEGLFLIARLRPRGELFHLVGSSWVSPFELGMRIAEAFDLDPNLIAPSLLQDYLKTDPRPRQRSLRLSNAKWTLWAGEHGLAAPLTIEEGLQRVRAEI